MGSVGIYFGIALLTFSALSGVALAFAGTGGSRVRKRITAVARPQATGRGVKGGADINQQRRKNVQAMLKELEKTQVERNKRLPLRRRIEMAGLTITTRTYWTYSAVAGVAAALLALATQNNLMVTLLVAFVFGFGLPRWTLSFMKKRREKAFTREFANAVDVIVRSVKTGLPVNEALKVVSTEIPDPVGAEFRQLVDSLKVGVTMEEALKRLFERMPTSEVTFFGIVMAIQQKTGGNLSEALQNLSQVLRDRKRLENKVRSMSSEAKASAMIIGSLPVGVMGLVYVTSPDYIKVLFQTDSGHLMLMGCGVWMALGVFVMKKMVSLKY